MPGRPGYRVQGRYGNADDAQVSVVRGRATIGRVKYKKGANEATLRPIRHELRRIGNRDQFDPAYRRLRYIRYADDFLLGFAGPREEAEEIKNRIGTFLLDSLKLEMSPEKTLITHAGTEKAR